MTEQNNRDDIRAAMLSGSKAKSKEITVFGVKLELRQPSMGEILDMQAMAETKQRVIHSLINYCYVPGTNEKVFDTTDTDALLARPFGKEFAEIQLAIAELTTLDIEQEKGNSEGAPVNIPS